MVSGAGHWRLLQQVDKVFGGFFWAINTDGRVVVVSTPPRLPPLPIKTGLFISPDQPAILAANNVKGADGLAQTYNHAHAGDTITYTVGRNGSVPASFTRPASLFTFDIWFQNYGLSLLAGAGWLLAGALLLVVAKNWSEGVESMSLLVPATLLLLYSHLGSVQQAGRIDLVIPLLWLPAFALPGATFLHLSLLYHPQILKSANRPRLVEAIPYLPLIMLLVYGWGTYLITGSIFERVNFLLSLGYAAVAILVSLGISLHALLFAGRLLSLPPGVDTDNLLAESPPPLIRRRLGNFLLFWIGGISIGLCAGILFVLPAGQLLFPVPIFSLLALLYPFVLLYITDSTRHIARLHTTLAQREAALLAQVRTSEELTRTSNQLQQATALLLQADAQLRSTLSQRIHDQPKQQALRIRSLLAHWQHKLRIESEQDPSGKVIVQPIIEALERVRKISEELEGDLRSLQLLVEDAHQRRSLGLKRHLEKLIREDLPALYPASPLHIQADLWALDRLSPDLEQTVEGASIAEAISYTVTQALLNIYNHAGANFATVRTVSTNGTLDIYIIDDGRGFDAESISPERTSLSKARLKAHAVGGTLTIRSIQRPQQNHGTTVILHLPLPASTGASTSLPPAGPYTQSVPELSEHYKSF